MDRRATIREGIASSRHLRSLARLGSVTPRDLDRLLGKIDAGLEAGMDVVGLLPPPATADFAETVARTVPGVTVGSAGEDFIIEPFGGEKLEGAAS